MKAVVHKFCHGFLSPAPVVLCVALLAVSPAEADPDADMLRLMEDGLNQFSGVSGTVDACDFRDSTADLEAMADRLAAWRYPSWWDGLTGTRDDYAKSLKLTSHLAYVVKKLAPCEGALFVGGYRMLRDNWRDTLTNWLK